MPKQPKKQAKAKKEVKADKPKKARIKTPAMIENPGGRPSEFDEAAPKIIEFIRKGNTYECSAACSRVSYRSFNRWMKQGEEDIEHGILNSKFCQFWHDVKQAEMEAEQEAVQAWRNFVPLNWQAARDFLARRNPDSWGSKDRVDVTSNGETVGKPFFMPMKDEEDE